MEYYLMWAGIKWLLGLLWGGIVDILRMIIKVMLVIIIILVGMFALGKVMNAEYQELKQSISGALDRNPITKLSWQGLMNSGTDPPVLYLEPIPNVKASIYNDPFGYQSPQIYEGYLVPLRL
jgi:hypothetical protein